MIKKQNLWFLTLFSLILVLSVYYITMPNDLLVAKNATNKKETVKKDTTTVKESDNLTALRVSKEEEREEEKSDLKKTMTKEDATTEEKNNAYEKLQEINTVTSEEATLEKKLKEKYKMSVFVKIENKEITVVVDNDKHDTTLANNIMRSVQENFKEKRYITVQFK